MGKHAALATHFGSFPTSDTPTVENQFTSSIEESKVGNSIMLSPIRKVRTSPSLGIIRTPFRTSRPYATRSSGKKSQRPAGLKRNSSDPELTLLGWCVEDVPATPSKSGRKNVKNKLRKVVGGSKESGLATISDPYESVRTFDSPLVFIAAGTNPWDLDERSFSPIASATTDSLSKLDVLSVITPPNRPRPVLEPPTIGSFKAYSDYSPSQTKLTVSNDTSPTMKGLSKKMVEIWLDREASGSRGDVAISSSLSIGMEGRDDEILMDDEDDEEDRMPFRGNIFKDIQPPSSTETDGDMFNTPAGSRCHRASFEQGFTPGFENHLRQAACSSQSSPNADPGYTNNAFDAFKNSPSNNNAEAVFRPFGLSPNVTLSRGKQMPPKFRGASTGSTMPSGPGVAQWRQNAPPGNRAVSHGTIEFPSSSSSSQLFGGFARNGHLMRKESILFEDENDREDRETFGYDDGIESREPFEYDDDMENWELFEDDMLL